MTSLEQTELKIDMCASQRELILEKKRQDGIVSHM